MTDPTAVRPCMYKVGKVLGEGTYAKVKQAFHIVTGQEFACKVFNKQLMRGREHMVLNEINILKSVSEHHPNLIHLVDYFESANNLYLIMDLCRGGELFYRICERGHYDESDAARIVRTICDTVAYLHDKGIVHRDLKPENLLFRTEAEDSDLLIADFGLARCLESDAYPLLTTTCGTPGFMAPEILQRLAYSKPVDVWSIGVIAYFLLAGYTPFDRNTTVDEIQAIINADYAFEPKEYWAHVSEPAKDFIRHCLRLDPNTRLTARQALAHPWLASLGGGAPGAPGAAPQGVNLVPGIRQNSRSSTDKFKSAVKKVAAAAAFAKAMGVQEHQLGNVPMPVDETLPMQ